MPKPKSRVRLRRAFIRNPSFERWRRSLDKTRIKRLASWAQFYRGPESYKERYENRNLKDYAEILGFSVRSLKTRINKKI